MATLRRWLAAALVILPLSAGHGFFLLCTTPSCTGVHHDCLPGFKKVFYKGGTSIMCKKCPETMSGVTQDGWDCITCPSGLTIEGKYTCANNEILVERNINGSLLKAALCAQCDGKEQSFSTANTLNNMCKRCQPTFISVNKSCSCSEPNILVFRSSLYPPEHQTCLDIVRANSKSPLQRTGSSRTCTGIVQIARNRLKEEEAEEEEEEELETTKEER